MTSGPHDDDIDAWLDDFAAAAAFDFESGTLHGRPFADYSLVARVATTGPRSAEEAQRLLADQELCELLRRAWADSAPGAELVGRLSGDTYGRSLLSLFPTTVSAPDEVPASGPRRVAWSSRLLELFVPVVARPLGVRAVSDKPASSSGIEHLHAESAGVTVDIERVRAASSTKFTAYLIDDGDADRALLVQWDTGDWTLHPFTSEYADVEVPLTQPTELAEPVALAVVTESELSAPEVPAPLAPNNLVNGPSAWWEGGRAVEVPSSQAHAAASGPDLPLVFAASFAEAAVTVEGRGGSDEFAVTAVAESSGAARFVAVQLVYGRSTTWMVLPLVPETPADVPAATVWCARPHQVRVNAIADLATELEDSIVADRVRLSVAAADGRTQEMWRGVARSEPDGSPLREAVLRGFGPTR